MIALNTSPVRLALARHNAALYGVADRIEIILSDFLDFARTSGQRPALSGRVVDVVFLSPSWGGLSYLTDTFTNLAPDVTNKTLDTGLKHPTCARPRAVQNRATTYEECHMLLATEYKPQ